MKNFLKKSASCFVGFLFALIVLYALANIMYQELGFIGFWTPKTLFLNEKIEIQKEISATSERSKEYWLKLWEKESKNSMRLAVDSIKLAGKYEREKEMSQFYKRNAEKNFDLYLDFAVRYKKVKAEADSLTKLINKF